MATLVQAVINRLLTAADVRDLLYGGIYDRRPQQEGVEATPDAFGPDGLLPCASVVVDDLVSLGPNIGLRAVRIRPRARKPDRATVELALWTIYDRLHHSQVATDHEGAGVPLVFVALRGPEQDPELPTAYMGEIEFTAAAAPPE